MKNDQLAPLLLSLTSAEKKYFVQLSQLRSDNKSYMKLYDCVLRDGKFNADKLSKELKKTKANLAHEKEYLIENVMKALRNYHDKEKLTNLKNLINDYEHLYRRNLPALSQWKHKKATTEAKRLAQHELSWRCHLDNIALDEMLLPREKYYSNGQKHVAAARASLQWMQTFTDLTELMLSTVYSYSERVYNLNEKDNEESNRFLAHPLLNKKFSDPQFRVMQYDMLAGIYKQVRNPDKATEHAALALKTIERYPYLAEQSELEYFFRVHNFVVPLISRGKLKLYERWLKKINSGYYKQLPFATSQLNAMFDAYLFGYHCVYYNFLWSQKKISRQIIIDFLLRLEANRQQLEKQLDTLYWYSMKQGIAALYFHQQMYAQSLEWINRLINEPESSRLLTQVQGVVRIMAVIVHYHLGNHVMLPGLIKSAERYLNKHMMLTEVEKTTLRFLHRLPSLLTKQEQRTAFDELLEQYLKMTEDRDLLLHLRMFDYRQWARRYSVANKPS